MYRIKLFGIDGTGDPVTTFARARLKGWSHRINAPGRMTFSLPWDDAQATDDFLQKYRAVRMLRKTRDGSKTYVAEWGGYIEAHKRLDNEIEVYCQGTLQLFKKRFTDADQTFTGQGSADAEALLDQTNADDGDTGVTFGTGGVTATQNTKVDAQDILRAWEEMGLATGGEFEIDPFRVFNFVPSLGSDKSTGATIVTLTFRRDRRAGSNVRGMEDGEDATDLVNKVIATSAVGGSYTAEDAASQAKYGVLIERRQFNTAQNAGTLEEMADRYVLQRANPITDFRVEPLLSAKRFNTATGQEQLTRLAYGDVRVGDLVACDIRTQNKSVTTAKRIAEIVVSVDENGAERVLYTLSEAGVYVTASMFDDARSIQELKRKVKEIEALL